MHAGTRVYPTDYSSILYLAQLGRRHSNLYRFSVELTEPVCPKILQQAANRVRERFPTIIAGIARSFFGFTMVPARSLGVENGDPGLLRTMSRKELERCGYRVFCSGNRIIIEAFHACTDGHGAMTSLRTLVGEYLRLRYGGEIPEVQQMLEGETPDWEAEHRDSYLDHACARPKGIPGRYAYQLPGENRNWQVKDTVEDVSTQQLLTAARRRGVSMTALLTCLMAEAVLEIQKKHNPTGREKPARIMVPIDLRRKFPSKSLRNFILYALPGLEAEEGTLSRQEKLERIARRLRAQTAPEYLAPVIARNVKVQQSPFFRWTPGVVKLAAMRLVYSFFGENNSSITLTNLGDLGFSEAALRYVRSGTVCLTPRRRSPYNCGVLSCGGRTRITISRFGAEPELEPLFFQKLREELQG